MVEERQIILFSGKEKTYEKITNLSKREEKM